MNIKQLKETPAYEELRAYVNNHVAPEKRAVELGLLAKRFLANYDREFHQGVGMHNLLVENVFNWAESPEGHGFWDAISNCEYIVNLRPCPIGKKKEPVVQEVVIPAWVEVVGGAIQPAAANDAAAQMFPEEVLAFQDRFRAHAIGGGINPHAALEAVKRPKKHKKVGWWHVEEK